MINNQGFLVMWTSSAGQLVKLTANFRYELMQEYESQFGLIYSISHTSFDKFDSICWQTMMGLLIAGKNQFRCFIGEKIDSIIRRSQEVIQKEINDKQFAFYPKKRS